MTEENIAQVLAPDVPATDTELREVALSRAEYNQAVEMLGRYPARVELGMIGALWSEHCGYKHSRPLFKMFPTTGPRVLQGPGENAGVVDIGDGLALALKMESHNHPSAVEPYQGAATGVGGIVRDIFTMGARPIAILDALRFGPLDEPHNRYLFEGVVAGIGGYGNSLGIPTVGGEINVHPSYRGNPLVNAMCVGIAPHARVTRASAGEPGNVLLMVGAATGRDGIHGATFASGDLDEAAMERRPAVQVGNPFLEKLLMEACLELLETDDVVGMQDLGAAGITSSAVECAGRAGTGIEIDVRKIARRERGMTAYEVMLSESQERMLVIVKPEAVQRVRDRFARWELHADAIGLVTTDGRVRIRDGDTLVVDVPTDLLTEGCPAYTPPAVESAETAERRAFDPLQTPDIAPGDVVDALTQLLSHPDVASKRPVWETYDHTIGTNTVLGPGTGDAAVLRVRGTRRGVALTTDCNARYCGLDPYLGGMHAVAEAARNLACVGAEPVAVTDCLNFGNPERPEIYFQLREAVRGLADACRALAVPVVSGNVSLYNDGIAGAILPTPIVGMAGVLDDIDRRVGMAFPPDATLLVLGSTMATLGASLYLATVRGIEAGAPPALDLTAEAAVQECVRRMIRQGQVRAAHDLADGGLAVALAEGCIAGQVGCEVALPETLSTAVGGRLDALLFGEAASRVILAVAPEAIGPIEECAAALGVPVHILGRTTETRHFALHGIMNVPLQNLITAWETALV
ncbi:MAG: phosphoribosylformylglycinamidine synthase subunit PurL [Thermomicrobia bacterium]|nr:phosphoribosylformylglycinamidine synthase subunit PurL [Thermomicrobia bacterium]